MERNYLDIFDEPVRIRRVRRSAGYSVAATVVVVALAVIVLLVLWQLLVPTNSVNVGDDPSVLLDQETADVASRQTANNGANATMSATEAAAVRAYALTELTAIQMRLETDDDYQSALGEVEDLEADLNDAYAQAPAGTRASWNELRGRFDELEDRLRENSTESFSVLEGLIETLEADVGVGNRATNSSAQ